MGRKLFLVGAALHRERPYTEKHQMEGSYMLKVKKMGFQKKLYITQRYNMQEEHTTIWNQGHIKVESEQHLIMQIQDFRSETDMYPL